MSDRPVRKAYLCTKCGKIDRKGRVEGHILKEHVPLDKVPFWCSLCLFRCQKRQTLVDHLTKYRRHVEAEARLTSQPNYTEVLRRASDPYVPSSKDMVPLGAEDALQDQAEDLFDEEEEDVIKSGGLRLPSWALGVEQLGRPMPPYIPTPIGKPQVSKSDPISNQPETWGSYQFVAQPLPPLEPQKVGRMATPIQHPNTRVDVTPCQDEESFPLDLSEEPLPKKLKATPQATASQEELDTRGIEKALTEGFRGVVDALNATTRAIRCQEKTSEKILAAMERLERRLGASQKEHQHSIPQVKRKY